MPCAVVQDKKENDDAWYVLYVSTCTKSSAKVIKASDYCPDLVPLESEARGPVGLDLELPWSSVWLRVGS